FHPFIFYDTATPAIYTLSLHDALPISPAPLKLPRSRNRHRRTEKLRAAPPRSCGAGWTHEEYALFPLSHLPRRSLFSSKNSAAKDRKSTRLNSSHLGISYAVFCLKKKT